MMSAKARYRSALRRHTTARRAYDKAFRALRIATKRANQMRDRLDNATEKLLAQEVGRIEREGFTVTYNPCTGYHVYRSITPEQEAQIDADSANQGQRS